jgi:hypothetical protein
VHKQDHIVNDFNVKNLSEGICSELALLKGGVSFFKSLHSLLVESGVRSDTVWYVRELTTIDKE